MANYTFSKRDSRPAVPKKGGWPVLVLLTAALFLAVATYNVFASGGKLRVVATIAPLADFARQVGGGKVEVMLLLPPGASPHTYEPTPKTVQEMSRAKVFIRIGAGLEFWADKFMTGMKGARIVTCSEGVNLIRGVHDEHVVSDVDPHIWLDPLICKQIVRKIADAFSEADPANASYYGTNASAYTARLTALDRQIAQEVKTFRTKEYVTFHSAWNYFSRRYGLKVVGVIEEAPGKEPTARHIGDILRKITAMRSKVVFAEPQFNPRIAEAIAREAGGKVLFLDPEGGQKGRETYIELMRYNLSVMAQAMR